MYYIGIDIAKRNHEVSIIDADGKSLSKSISIANSQKGLDDFNNYLSSFNVTSQNSIIGMESTGHYWLNLYSSLVNLNFNVFVINPIQTDAFRKMYIRKTKNDSKDSYIIAQIMRFGEFSSSSISDENIFAIRQLSRYRSSLVDECSNWKRKVITILDQVFPEYSDLFSDTFGVTSKELLSKYPLPENMLEVSTKELTSLLNKASKGRFGIEKAQEIKEYATKSFGISFAKETFSFQIKQIINQISFIESQLKELEEKITNILKTLNSEITTITGIGDILGASILGEIGDISRFEKASQLVAFAGLDVAINQSGEFTGTEMKITKRGSPYLRRSIWIAATVACFKDPALSVYYKKLIDRGKKHLTAVGAVARKMCNIIFSVLKNKKPYTPNI
ncbi:IS110 family transposase [Fusobacterium polymorphum]|uniref:IS110 family transposase n=1 Tax=Fusobacterium nucleatum subsp. polymorphum TaxID=76857 RepID=UPI00300A29AC